MTSLFFFVGPELEDCAGKSIVLSKSIVPMIVLRVSIIELMSGIWAETMVLVVAKESKIKRERKTVVFISFEGMKEWKHNVFLCT